MSDILWKIYDDYSKTVLKYPSTSASEYFIKDWETNFVTNSTKNSVAGDEELKNILESDSFIPNVL